MSLSARPGRANGNGRDTFTGYVHGVGEAPGVIKIKAPPCWLNQENAERCLYPGMQVLIVNATNGHVVSVTAGNNGEIDDTIDGTMDHVLIITVTDPFGLNTSFTRSQFVDPVTGATAIGPGGGVVKGEDGVEMRIPEGALEKGVKIKLSPIREWSAAEMRGEPEMGVDEAGQPLAHFGSGIRIESYGETSFKTEAKLAFPVRPRRSRPRATDPRTRSSTCSVRFWVHVRMGGRRATTSSGRATTRRWTSRAWKAQAPKHAW